MTFDDFIKRAQCVFISVVIACALYFGISDAISSPIDDINISYSEDTPTEVDCIFTTEGAINFTLERQHDGLFYQPLQSISKSTDCVYYRGAYSFQRQDLRLFKVNDGGLVLLKLVNDHVFQFKPRVNGSYSDRNRTNNKDVGIWFSR